MYSLTFVSPKLLTGKNKVKQTNRTLKKKPTASQLNDEHIFLNGVEFIVKVAEQHWGTKLRKSFPTFQEAMEEVEKHNKERCLIYAVTAEGRFAVIGHANFNHFQEVLGYG